MAGGCSLPCSCTGLSDMSREIKYNNGTVITNPRYSEITRDNYFYYRIYKIGVLDHGIVGADLFFSRLCENYEKAYNDSIRWEGRQSREDFYNSRGLHFNREQLKIFAYIADCIASHNMYKADRDQESIKIYNDYHLKELLPDKFKKISYKDNPLLFILCVADTIEPSKRFAVNSNATILSKIELTYQKQNNSLLIHLDSQISETESGQNYMSGVKELEEWCDIQVRET